MFAVCAFCARRSGDFIRAFEGLPLTKFLARTYAWRLRRLGLEREKEGGHEEVNPSLHGDAQFGTDG